MAREENFSSLLSKREDDPKVEDDKNNQALNRVKADIDNNYAQIETTLKGTQI